ncbi:MAG: S-methyl-5-thioribose-1-phosphate isomerase [Bdellovibrionota bacterium]
MNSLGLRCGEHLEILDQTLLPAEEKWVRVGSPAEMIGLIQRLAVRGAPLIGVAAGLALGRFASSGASDSDIRSTAAALRESRPTAVNLMNAIDRLMRVYGKRGAAALLPEAQAIFQEDVALCEAMAARGAELIASGDGILTHCNTGGLATVGRGTALGVISKAWAQGKKIHVYVDETRPLLQGARLTAWELQKLGIPYTLICDNMAASLLRTGKVKAAFVGADRVAVNGDVANKIGTYGVAVLCKHHSVPFYVVAPSTTYDPTCLSGAAIPIEERGAGEVRGTAAPASAAVWNPAFDVTPRELITKIIFEDRSW